MNRLEEMDSDSVKEGGSKVLELAEAQEWSSAFLYVVLVGLAEFLEATVLESVDVEDIYEN